MHAASIALISPIYNRGEELPRAIWSAVGQSSAPLEILVIDAAGNE
jgi:hypothetical protein